MGMEAPDQPEVPLSPHDRVTAFGNQLVEVHIRLREDLEALREGVEDFLDGRGERPRGLRQHCLAFCSALTRHHEGEDGGAFPVLAQRFPELRPVIVELERDHRIVADALRSLTALINGLSARSDAARVLSEVDTLAALMETHFTHEEKRIVSALNSLDVPDWAASPPRFLSP